jgi:Protein of unknown function (DUF3551)
MKTFGLLALVGATVFAGPTASFAQSAYDYPWCSIRAGRTGGGGQSCYFSTYEQCMATISGIGGTCVRSPYYHGPRVRERRYQRNERY